MTGDRREQTAEEPFGSAESVHVGCVEQGDTQLVRADESRVRGLRVHIVQPMKTPPLVARPPMVRQPAPRAERCRRSNRVG